MPWLISQVSSDTQTPPSTAQFGCVCWQSPPLDITVTVLAEVTSLAPTQQEHSGEKGSQPSGGTPSAIEPPRISHSSCDMHMPPTTSTLQRGSVEQLPQVMFSQVEFGPYQMPGQKSHTHSKHWRPSTQQAPTTFSTNGGHSKGSQLLVQSSYSNVLPSSHCSPSSTIPSPQKVQFAEQTLPFGSTEPGGSQLSPKSGSMSPSPQHSGHRSFFGSHLKQILSLLQKAVDCVRGLHGGSVRQPPGQPSLKHWRHSLALVQGISTEPLQIKLPGGKHPSGAVSAVHTGVGVGIGVGTGCEGVGIDGVSDGVGTGCEGVGLGVDGVGVVSLVAPIQHAQSEENGWQPSEGTPG